MAITTRSATLADINAILAVELQAATAGHFTNQQYEQRVTDGFLLVGEAEGSISGFVCARAVAQEWEIENIVVTQSVRRSGVAERLLGEFVEHATARGATAIWLEVRESNQPARQLYEKHGFQPTGKRRAYYRNPEEDAVVYSLVLLQK